MVAPQVTHVDIVRAQMLMLFLYSLVFTVENGHTRLEKSLHIPPTINI